MRVLFDTSVLIAAVLTGHAVHLPCRNWLERASQQSDPIQGLAAAHTLAESYAVLTRMPQRPIVTPAVARTLITDALQDFELITLNIEDYWQVLEWLEDLNLSGGGIYDALIARAAVAAGAERLLTLNPRHFLRLGENVAPLVEVPQ